MNGQGSEVIPDQHHTLILKIDEKVFSQEESCTTFIGGIPRLPGSITIPHCKLCDAQLTFFFQIGFPQELEWGGLSLAVFACTSCAHEDYTIPPMLAGDLRGVNIPAGFLDSYQINFRLVVFMTDVATLRTDYIEKVKFKKWNLLPVNDPYVWENKIGGEPNWIQGDETPATYADESQMIFLLQIVEEFEFEILESAPPQKRIFEFPGLQSLPFYRLWNGNGLYFFGTRDYSPPLVYALTQID